MSMDGVVPPQSGPSRRPAGGPVNHSGAELPQGPAARRYGAQGHTGGEHATEEHGSQERGVPERGFPDHGVPEPGAHAVNHPRFERVVGGAENGDAIGASEWHGPIGTGGMPDDPAAGRNDGIDVTTELDVAGLRSGGAPLSAAESNLADALRATVAGVGLAGPPPGGLVRIRRKARTRQRNRMVVAGSAGILMLAVAVTMATGARFDIVPTLTGASGASGGGATGNQPGPGTTTRASTAANGGHVVWPTGSPGKTGLAIGPVAPVVANPSAVAAAQMPLCTATSLKASTTMGPTVNGVSYGHVDAVAQSSCVTVGPPVLTVANQTGTASSSVVILKEDTAVASLLPSVPTWGRTMALKAGQGYEFQFAWAATACAQGSASPNASPVIAPNTASLYYLGYAVTGTTPTAVVALNAPCGAQVYVTDIYNMGAFPLPKAPVPPPPVVSSSAPPPSSPPPPPVSSSPASSPSTGAPSPSPSVSSSASSGGVASGNATTPSG